MFLGTYLYTVDPKGRLFIPAKLRGGKAPKGGSFIVTQGLEMCLYLYESATFHGALSEKLENLPVKNQQEGRAFKRLLLSRAQDVELDDMGRILIPRTLMEFSGFKKNVTIIGVGERIELWDETKWKSYSRKAHSTFQKLGKDLEI